MSRRYFKMDKEPLVQYQYPDDEVVLSREEQDRQEALFQTFQSKLQSKTITQDERDYLFTIIHNCSLSQLKRRKKLLLAKGLKFRNYDSSQLESMAVDCTLRLLDAMEHRGRFVRYIIKTADFLALYELHNKQKVFDDTVDYTSIAFDDKLNALEYIEELDLDTLDKLDSRVVIKIIEKGRNGEFTIKEIQKKCN